MGLDAINLAIYSLLAAVCLACVAWAATHPKRPDPKPPLNPYAHLLGRVVEVKVYQASDWERMVVVAVSWHGAVCVRRVADMESRGRWIRKELAPDRVREIDE